MLGRAARQLAGLQAKTLLRTDSLIDSLTILEIELSKEMSILDLCRSPPPRIRNLIEGRLEIATNQPY